MVKRPLKALGETNSTIAFHDNSSAIRGRRTDILTPVAPMTCSPLAATSTDMDITYSCETHNFPTGIAPFPGAADGLGEGQVGHVVFLQNRK